VLYRSPPSAYKQGRDAPGWYARLVIPDLQPVELPVFGGSLVIRSNASRAVLDGWDDMKAQMLGTLVLLLAVNLLVFAIVGRCLQPLSDVRAVLDRMGQGDYAVRLPRLPGAEAQSMGEAVNRLGAAIETNRAASLQGHRPKPGWRPSAVLCRSCSRASRPNAGIWRLRCTTRWASR